MYFKQASFNGTPLSWFLYLFFVPEINQWTVSKNKNMLMTQRRMNYFEVSLKVIYDLKIFLIYCLQINTNTALGADPANERSPIAYYDDNAFCVQDISGSSWNLINLSSGGTETDSTMQVTCS